MPDRYEGRKHTGAYVEQKCRAWASGRGQIAAVCIT